MEIERKFLLRAIPGGKIVQAVKQQQGYFSLDPEVRFRRNIEFNPITFEDKGEPNYKGSIKSVGLGIRDEVEDFISKDFYYHMVDVIGKPFIEKLLYILDYNGTKVECSIVDKGSDTSFMYGEVEFKSAAEGDKFIWPWPNIMIREVTTDPSFYMQNYWKRTRLD